MNVLPNLGGHTCADDHAGHGHHYNHDVPDTPVDDEEDHGTTFLHCHGGVILTETIHNIPSLSSWDLNDQKLDNYCSIYGFSYLGEIWHPPA